jgi:putative transcriptional regulator
MKKIKIANHVRKYRFLNGEMTQKDLAKAVSVSRQTIGAIEKGQYSPTLELCFKLSVIFNTPIDQIFFIESIDGVKKEQKDES